MPGLFLGGWGEALFLASLSTFILSSSSFFPTLNMCCRILYIKWFVKMPWPPRSPTKSPGPTSFFIFIGTTPLPMCGTQSFRSCWQLQEENANLLSWSPCTVGLRCSMLPRTRCGWRSAMWWLRWQWQGASWWSLRARRWEWASSLSLFSTRYLEEIRGWPSYLFSEKRKLLFYTGNYKKQNKT